MKKIVFLGITAMLLASSASAETRQEQNSRIASDTARDMMMGFDRDTYMNSQRNIVKDSLDRMQRSSEAEVKMYEQRKENLKRLEK